MKSKLVALICLFLFLPACCYPVRYDGPYKGRVIDAETEHPIEGVVVLGVWSKVAVTPAGGVSSYYDAQETITDRNGEFEIPGLGLKILSNVAPMNVLIFKAGYGYIEKAAWKGDKVIIPLKKLTMEEREKSATFPPLPPTEAALEKVKLMLQEVNKEATERAIKPIDIWRGEKL